MANIDENKDKSEEQNDNIVFNAKTIEEALYEYCHGKSMNFYKYNQQKLISKLQVTNFRLNFASFTQNSLG